VGSSYCAGGAWERAEFAGFYAVSFPRLVGQLSPMTCDRAEAQDAVQMASAGSRVR